ncbi:MAG: Signal recognition particle core component [Candelina mexicana]|nr:MAG: Signal recognition particle core component [Candelina mexicana]
MAALKGQTLSSLLQQATLDDHEEVLKASNTILRKSKHELEPQHAKVVALLKLDRFEDALKVFEDGGNQFKERAALERAYALYKVGNLEEAAAIASGSDGSRGIKHVEAQATYRLEDFAKTAELYKQLREQKVGIRNEENDLRINSGATDAQLEWMKQGHLVAQKKPGREDLEAFETAYNAACGSIARGELGQGQVLLNRAKDLCNSLEELSDEEKATEILPIVVQQIYVLSGLQKTEEAIDLSSSITIADISDIDTRKIAQNNSISISPQPSNPYTSQRLIKSTPVLPGSAKPFRHQSDILHRNAYTLDLLSLKYTGVANSTSKFLSKHPSPTVSTNVNSVSVLNAAAHAGNQVAKPGLIEILPLLEQRPNDIGLILTVIQLYLLTNDHTSAINLLESFFARLEASTTPSNQDVRFAPGLIGLLISLYTLQGRKTHIRTELSKAASYWRRKQKPDIALLRAAGSALLESSKVEDLAAAAEIFSDLHSRNPNDRYAIAGYVASHAATSQSKLGSEADKLTSTQRLISDIDVDALEAAGIATLPIPSSTNTKKRSTEDDAKPAKKRIRKSRLPKNYDPNKPPDPERWLPMRDRSSYRPKGKKGKTKQAALTQGGVVEKGEESLELAGGAGKVKVEKVGGGGGGAVAGKKKAKAKGKR